MSVFGEWISTLPQQFRPERTNSDSLYDFVCDTEKDLKSLPDCAMGSTALVVEPAGEWMKATAGWFPQTSENWS